MSSDWRDEHDRVQKQRDEALEQVRQQRAIAQEKEGRALAAERERDELRAALTLMREDMDAIILNDKTQYEHHEARPSDGLKPRQAGGGSIFLTPKEIATRVLARLSRLSVRLS